MTKQPETAPDERLSPWLRCVFPDKFPEVEDDMFMDETRFRLEVLVTDMTNRIAEGMELDPATSRAVAANLLVEQGLVIQRQHAADGYVKMMDEMAAHDPALAPIRRSIAQHVSRATSHAMRQGFLVALVTSVIIALCALPFGISDPWLAVGVLAVIYGVDLCQKRSSSGG